MYRAAVVGCGRIGSRVSSDPRVKGVYSHAAAYVAHAKTQLVAVCDIDAGRARDCSQEWGLEGYFVDVQQMLDAVRPDIVSVCTPTATHEDVLYRAMSSPGVVGVLAEKPLTGRLDAAERLLRFSQDQGVVVAVNYSRRYAGNLEKAREIFASGGIGELQAVGGYYTQGLFHGGTHWLDLLRWFAGEVFEAQAMPLGDSRSDNGNVDFMLRLGGGIHALVHGCDETHYTLFEMDLVGTAGRMTIGDLGHRIDIYSVGENPDYSGYRSLLPVEVRREGLGDVTLRAVDDLVACLLDGTALRCSAKDGVAVLRIAEAIQQSAHSGRTVVVSEVDGTGS